jgi:alginate O-acetyltransferase complex protein AlgI
MLFNSFGYAVFLAVVTALYFLLPQKCRVVWLLASSSFFYMVYQPVYILVLLTLILIDYAAALGISAATGRRARHYLWVSIAATCSVLFVFKYYNFVNESIAWLVEKAGRRYAFHPLELLLPIGLSFHTFQSLSYVIEVYRRRQAPERNFLVYATYVMFFPQLVAGPIERPQHLLHQFRETHVFDSARVISGLKRIAWGLYKKCVVADRLALFVRVIFDNPREHNGVQLLLGAVFFSYQVYCDFSGYSDIAIGSARMLGFRLMENFQTPFHARSISDLWRRWHISLTTWLRDYVFVPMGGSRVEAVRLIRNYLVTFGLGGIWHGANWTFAVWGLLNGCLVLAGTLTRPMRERWFHGWLGYTYWSVPLGVAGTFLLFCAGAVFFRAQNVTDAVYILSHVSFDWNAKIALDEFGVSQLRLAFAAIVILEAGELLGDRLPIPDLVATLPLPVRWSAYIAFVLGLALFGVYENNPFIYFQF